MVQEVLQDQLEFQVRLAQPDRQAQLVHQDYRELDLRELRVPWVLPVQEARRGQLVQPDLHQLAFQRKAPVWFLEMLKLQSFQSRILFMGRLALIQ